MLSCVILLLAGVASWLYDPYVDDPPETSTWLNPNTPEYRAILSYAELNLGCVADFRRLYPSSEITIYSRYPAISATTIHCQALAYGRYEVGLAQRVRTNRKELTAVALGEPRLAVVELEQIGYLPANGGLTKCGRLQRFFGGRTWRQLVSANGDLAAVIKNPVKDRPLEFAVTVNLK